MSGCIGWIDHCRGDVNGAPTLLDGGSIFAALAFDSAYPARNCMTPDVSRVTRINYVRKSTGNNYAALRFELSAQDDKRVQVVAALNCRLAVGQTTGISQILCATLNTSLTAQQTGTAFTQGTIVPIPGTTDRFDLFWLFSTEAQVSHVEIRFFAPVDSDDYIEFGRVWAGPCVYFSGGLGVDWSLSGVDPSRIYRSEGGGYAAFPYPTRKLLTVSKKGMDYATAMGEYEAESMRDFILGAGLSNPCVVISSDQDQHMAQTMSVYGLLQRMPQLDQQGLFRFGTSLQVEQLR